MKKLKLVSIGSCTAMDILKSDPRYHYDFACQKYFLGSISRSYYPPGKIANRLLEDIGDTKILNPQLQRQVDAILKRNTPLEIINTIDKDSIVLLDFGYETVNFFFNELEIFDINPNYLAIKSMLPQWLNDEITKHAVYFDCGISELVRHRWRSLRKFCYALAEKSVPVIVFDNMFTNKIYNESTNSVAEVMPALFNTKVSISSKSFRNDEVLQYQHSLDTLNSFYENLKSEMPKTFKWFSIDQNLVYADLNHPMGYHPVHYHKTCNEMLCTRLKSLIVNEYYNYKSTPVIELDI